MPMRSIFAKAFIRLLLALAFVAPVTAQAQDAVNTGRVAVPLGLVDPTPGNNESIDTDTIIAPQELTLVKSVVNTVGVTAEAIDRTVSATGPSTISGVSGSIAVTAATVTAGFIPVPKLAVPPRTRLAHGPAH